MPYVTVDQAFKLLKEYHITTHKESVRRWLRNGTLQGIPPASRKVGWRIDEDVLRTFIEQRASPATPVGKEDRDAIRADMWGELVRKNIFEDRIVVTKTAVQECIVHRGHSKDFERYVWNEIKDKSHTKQPTIPYLLEAALFDNQRIRLDRALPNIEEQVLFAVVEYLRLKKTGKLNNTTIVAKHRDF